MVKAVDLKNRGVVSEVDCRFMELSELQLISEEIQSEIFELSKEKRSINSLPKCKKDTKTLKRYNRTVDRLCDLHDALNWVSRLKKQKRDTMAKDKQWYRNFFIYARENLRKSQFEKFIEQTNLNTGYSIDL